MSSLYKKVVALDIATSVTDSDGFNPRFRPSDMEHLWSRADAIRGNRPQARER
jgi:hypothetical protein